MLGKLSQSFFYNSTFFCKVVILLHIPEFRWKIPLKGLRGYPISWKAIVVCVVAMPLACPSSLKLIERDRYCTRLDQRASSKTMIVAFTRRLVVMPSVCGRKWLRKLWSVAFDSFSVALKRDSRVSGFQAEMPPKDGSSGKLIDTDKGIGTFYLKSIRNKKDFSEGTFDQKNNTHDRGQ